MRRGTVGSENFNKRLQEILNDSPEETIRGGRNFRVGDKVMQVRNNYDYEVFKRGTSDASPTLTSLRSWSRLNSQKSGSPSTWRI